MKHLKTMTVKPAQDDAAGFIFFQIWAAVMTAILSKAFS